MLAVHLASTQSMGFKRLGFKVPGTISKEVENLEALEEGVSLLGGQTGMKLILSTGASWLAPSQIPGQIQKQKQSSSGNRFRGRCEGPP